METELNGQSLSFQEDKLAKLKEAFPELFSENKLDWEKLKATFTDQANFSNERYTLNWAGKADAFKCLQQQTTATLKPAPDESVNFDTTENVFIEGENLEVLKILQKAYYGKIKCIVIDPPYNTGNDSFIYPDNFKENKADYEKRIGERNEEGFLMKEGLFRKNSKDSGHFHSNWLSMMHPRLSLAKNMLKDDGAIFVFIDDNEIHNLLLIMNSIFGEENFLTSIAWKHTQQSKNDELYFSRHYNSIVIYRKSNKLERFRFERTPENNKNYSNPDNDINGPWRSGDVRSPNYRKNLCYDIQTPGGKTIKAPSNGWRWSKEEVLKKLAANEIFFSSDETRIIRKIYLYKQEGRIPENLWDGEQYGTTRIANAELKILFDDLAVFDTPKPTHVIKRIIELATRPNQNDIVLDFFAGSATTAHAVLSKNKEDGGNRKFILIQLPEPIDDNAEAYKKGYKTIADVSKERIRKVVTTLNEKAKEALSKTETELSFEDSAKPASSAALDVSGFKVFKLTPSNFKTWRGKDVSEKNLVQQLEAFSNPVNEDFAVENMLYELMLKAGYPLTEKITSNEDYYTLDNGTLIIVLTGINAAVIAKILSANPQKVIALDLLFSGKDELKTNTVLQMRAAKIDFKTI